MVAKDSFKLCFSAVDEAISHYYSAAAVGGKEAATMVGIQLTSMTLAAVNDAIQFFSC